MFCLVWLEITLCCLLSLTYVGMFHWCNGVCYRYQSLDTPSAHVAIFESDSSAWFGWQFHILSCLRLLKWFVVYSLADYTGILNIGLAQHFISADGRRQTITNITTHGHLRHIYAVFLSCSLFFSIEAINCVYIPTFVSQTFTHWTAACCDVTLWGLPVSILALSMCLLSGADFFSFMLLLKMTLCTWASMAFNR